MKKFSIYAILALLAVCLTFQSCQKGPNPEEVKKMEDQFKTFMANYKASVKPLTIEWYKAYFQASVVNTPENWEKVAAFEMKYNGFISNKDEFQKLKKIKDSKLVLDSSLQRQLKILYNEYLSKQIDTNKLNAMTKLSTEIEQKYAKFRAEVDGKMLTDNDVEEVLKTSKDSKELEAVWMAHKKIGPIVSADIIRLVKMRNEVAKELGYNNYHEMSLLLSDQEPKDVLTLFDELDNLTRDAFKVEKAKMDAILAKECNIKVDEMMPWHYQNRFFQEAPKVYEVDLDQYYTGKNLVKLAETFYKGLNMPIDDMVAKSDLFEKEGKNQHAYCIDIDRDGRDIRVLCNVKDNSKWMETLLHEFGHSLYEKYLGEDLPWVLKTPAHTFTTEAIAMMFGRFASNPQWIMDMLGISKEEAEKIAVSSKQTLRLQQLVFSRWSQVMYRFEKGMYENPDQDLNKLWWDLAEKYQMIKRPAGRNEPDWATKIHIATSPCYYHNYHLGELLASQLFYTINEKVLKTKDYDHQSFVGKTEVGKFLIDNVFAPGAKWYWNDMILKATGEKLTAKYYAKQFVGQ